TSTCRTKRSPERPGSPPIGTPKWGISTTPLPPLDYHPNCAGQPDFWGGAIGLQGGPESGCLTGVVMPLRLGWHNHPSAGFRVGLGKYPISGSNEAPQLGAVVGVPSGLSGYSGWRSRRGIHWGAVGF